MQESNDSHDGERRFSYCILIRPLETLGSPFLSPQLW